MYSQLNWPVKGVRSACRSAFVATPDDQAAASFMWPAALASRPGTHLRAHRARIQLEEAAGLLIAAGLRLDGGAVVLQQLVGRERLVCRARRRELWGPIGAAEDD